MRLVQGVKTTVVVSQPIIHTANTNEYKDNLLHIRTIKSSWYKIFFPISPGYDSSIWANHAPSTTYSYHMITMWLLDELNWPISVESLVKGQEVA